MMTIETAQPQLAHIADWHERIAPRFGRSKAHSLDSNLRSWRRHGTCIRAIGL